MKGRTLWNEYIYRKKDILEFLVEHNGEAQWKTLKAHLKELKWGPTTLKLVLDKMIDEGIIQREARLSKKNAEVWYVLSKKKVDFTSEIADLKRQIAEKEQTIRNWKQLAGDMERLVRFSMSKSITKKS